MKLRILPLAVGFALVAASCGVNRDADLAGTSNSLPEDTQQSAEEQDGEESSAGEDPAPAPTTTAPPPATTAPDGDVAVTVDFANGESVEVLHGELNGVIGPTQDNQVFVDLVYRGQIPPGFNAVVLSQTILGQAIDNELTAVGAETSEADRAEAQTLLFQQLTSLMPAAGDPTAEAQQLLDDVPYLQFILDLQARQISLSNYLAENAPEGEGNACVRHILVETEAEGDTIQVDLAAGADFSELAVERSTGPTGPNGGDLGCAPSSNYVPEFAAAVDGAELGEFVGPIETQFGWHVLVVDRYEVDGDALAQQTLSTNLEAATVDVDERVGAWDPTRLTIIPTGS